MSASVEQIVVQATARERRKITAKARRLGLSVSELMNRAAAAYEPIDEVALSELAVAAREAAERAIRAIDESLDAIAESNRRIDAMEAQARRRRPGEPHGLC
ncbi:MAG: hypothetical protein LT106_13670 [Burkholderiaceae bacterium]|nr:hypothetical protein [Burkholderiaceae bacterium]